MATMEVKFSPEDLKAAQSAERIPEPTVVVIFGASGDLTKRKLLARSLPPGAIRTSCRRTSRWWAWRGGRCRMSLQKTCAKAFCSSAE